MFVLFELVSFVFLLCSRWRGGATDKAFGLAISRQAGSIKQA